MLFALLGELIFFLIMGLLINEKIKVLTIYNAIWIFIVFMCSLHLYQQIPYSTKSYFVVFLGTVGFSLGYLIFRVGKLPLLRIKNDRHYYYSFNSKITLIILFVIFIYLFYKSIFVLRLFLSGVSLSNIRYEYFVRGKIIIGFENVIFTWLVTPIINYCLVPINIINLTSEDNKYKKEILILSILDAFLKIFITQGKENLIVYILGLTVCFFQFDFGKEARKKIVKIIILSILLIFVLSAIRAAGQSSHSTIYGYIGIEMNLIDYWTKYIDANNIHSYGLNFIYGFMNLPISFIEQFGINFPSFDRMTSILTYINSEGITVFPWAIFSTNVYLTSFTYFYMDFRYTGILIESLIFGGIIGYLSKFYFYDKDKNIINMIRYNILIVSALSMFITWEYWTTAICMSYIVARVFFNKYVTYDSNL